MLATLSSAISKILGTGFFESVLPGFSITLVLLIVWAALLAINGETYRVRISKNNENMYINVRKFI